MIDTHVAKWPSVGSALVCVCDPDLWATDWVHPRSHFDSSAFPRARQSFGRPQGDRTIRSSLSFIPCFTFLPSSSDPFDFPRSFSNGVDASHLHAHTRRPENGGEEVWRFESTQDSEAPCGASTYVERFQYGRTIRWEGCSFG